MADSQDIVLSVPVNGAGPVDVMMQDPPAGAWEVEINSIELKAKGEKIPSLHIGVTVVESGPAQGISTLAFIGTDWTKDFNLKHFVNLFTGMMELAGKSDQEIKAKLVGTVQLPLSALKGRHAYIFVKAAPDELDEQGRKPFSDKNFVTKTMYLQGKKMDMTTLAAGRGGAKKTGSAPDPFAGGPGPIGNGATGPAAGTTPPPPPAAAGAALGDLFG